MKTPYTREITNVAISVLTVMPMKEDHESLDSILAAPAWAVHRASTVSSAVTLLSRVDPIPVVLCEKDLGGGSWRDMLDHIHGMSDPPYLIVTLRLADEQLWAEALNLGAYDVIAKPFDGGEVERSLTSAWSRWWRDSHVGEHSTDVQNMLRQSRRVNRCGCYTQTCNQKRPLLVSHGRFEDR